MSHAATLSTAGPAVALVPSSWRIDRWRPRGHKADALRHPVASLSVVPSAVRPFTASIPTPSRHRPRIDVRIEVARTHITVHQYGKSVVIAGAGEDLCERLLDQVAREAATTERPLIVVVQRSGEDVAMTVHPCGTVEELLLCCA